MKTATFLRSLSDWRGDARLYKLSVPMKYEEIGDDEEHECAHVIVSAVNPPIPSAPPETFIFPADESGKQINFLEMHGSFRGGMDHVLALANAGYYVLESAA